MSRHYDLVVIGAGSGAKLASEAAAGGFKVAHVEKGPFGGTCVNRGCIPSKMTIYPADVMRTVETSGKLNLSIPKPEVDYPQLIERVTARVDGIADEALESTRKKENMDVYHKPAKFVSDRKLDIEGDIVTGDRFYLSVGAKPKIPPIPGLEGTPFLTSTTALRLKERPKRIILIGGGFIAAEMGHFFATYGAEVEILCRSTFLKGLDDTICTPLKTAYIKHHTVFEYAATQSVAYNNGTFTVNFTHGGEDKSTEADALLIATGVVPETDDIGLENTSIKLDKRGFILVDDHLKTSEPHTYAFGDCTGHALFRHMANFDRNYLLGQLLKTEAPRAIQYPPIPYAVFTHPQVGVVGKTEQDFEAEGRAVFCGLAEMKGCAMGWARRLEEGMVKLIFDSETRKLLSAHIFGDEASTLIQILIAYIQMGATVDDIASTVFIHPALPEVVYFAALDAKARFKAFA